MLALPQIRYTRMILEILPGSNWYKRSEVDQLEAYGEFRSTWFQTSSSSSSFQSNKANTQHIPIRYGSRAHHPSEVYSASEIVHLFLNIIIIVVIIVIVIVTVIIIILINSNQIWEWCPPPFWGLFSQRDRAPLPKPPRQRRWYTRGRNDHNFDDNLYEICFEFDFAGHVVSTSIDHFKQVHIYLHCTESQRCELISLKLWRNQWL